MNILIKIATISVVFLLLSIILKNNRPEYAFILRIFTVALIFYIALDYILDFINSYSTLFSNFNLESSHLTLLLKVIGVALITDFISDTMIDSGETALANTVTVVSKFIILFLTMPILNGIIIFCLKFIE